MLDANGFARRLDVALRARHVGKMYALAVALGIDESALSRWRRGKSMSIDNLLRLTRHLNVSVDWLLTGAGSMDGPERDPASSWQCEMIADLATLDPETRGCLGDLTRNLADARRIAPPAPCDGRGPASRSPPRKSPAALARGPAPVRSAQ